MKPSHGLCSFFLGICAVFASSVSAQTSFSFGREVRYPTDFTVQQNNTTQGTGVGQGTARVGNPPIVVPGGFKTRKVGTRVEVQHIGVRGTVSIGTGANGREVATLQPNGGKMIRVATGSRFTWGGHILHAKGWQGDEYIVVDMTTRRSYSFTRK